MLRLVIVSCLLALALGSALPKARKPIRKLAPIFPSGKIVGGTQTPIEDVPYQVAIEYSGFQFCGGSKIAPNQILCAGHCIEDFSAREVTVRLGSSRHESGGQLVQATKLTGHPDYDSNTIDFDVSIITLAENVPDSDASQTVAPADSEPAADTSVIISGWGTLTENGDTPTQLQSVTVPIVDRATCEDAYASFNDITARMICAGVTGKDSCQGDSGGPVVAGSGDNRSQVGIVSWGLGCARRGYPGVYTNVANPDIRDFIRQIAGV